MAQCDAIELKEKSHNGYIQLLQSLLARVSIVAEGQNDALDNELSALRGELRKAPSDTVQLSNRLEQINTLVRRLDAQHETAANSGLETFQLLIDQLLSLELSRENKKALQRLTKQLKSQGNDLGQCPPLLKEYVRVQGATLAGCLAEKSKGSEAGGIMSRIFGGGKTKPSQEPSSASETKISQDLQPPTADDSGNSRVIADKESDQSVAENQNTPPEPKPVAPPHLEPICAVLTGLLHQLEFPEDFREKARQLGEQFAQRPKLEEFDVAVDELAKLIIEATGKNQQDFENFLQSLESRLVEINGYLEQSRQTEQERLSSSSEIDQTMRTHAESISEQVRTATDIDVLKSSVQQHIDNITAAMDGYIDAEKHREQAISSQMETLQERLALVEGESKAIKKRLQVERIRALTDVLTGVPNRDALNERLSMEWDRFQRYKHPISLGVLDIDHFKMINDKYGHLVGDRALQSVATNIKKSIRKTDFVARFGGEEFVIVMPDTKADSAVIAMNKLRETIAKMKYSFLNGEDHITVSIGIVGFRVGSKLETLFEYADKALYKAKDNGRNRVEIY